MSVDTKFSIKQLNTQISIEQLTVKYKHYEMIINPVLLHEQDAWENIDIIKSLWILRWSGWELLKETQDIDTLKTIDNQLTFIEYRLQDAWKFNRNKNYHRFWERPKCRCPKLDNMDRYPYSQIYNETCPLHGKKENHENK